MKLFNRVPHVWRRRIALTLFYACAAIAVLSLGMGPARALAVFVQLVILLFAWSSLCVAIWALIAGVPMMLKQWRRQHVEARTTTIMVYLALTWGPAFWLAGGTILQYVSGRFMGICWSCW